MPLINKEERFFIAGSSGMVGSAIKRKLEQNQFSNLLTPKRSDLDLSDFSEVSKWFKKEKPSVVILAAAKVGGIYANKTYPTEFLLENLKIQSNIIENAWKNQVKRFLFLGSSCIYPRNTFVPIKEESILKGPLESTNEYYALAKISGLKLCQALRKQYDFDAISLMPTNLYGKGDNYKDQNSHVLPALLSRFHNHSINNKEVINCWGSGKPYREFMHVDDLADACLFALENWDPKEINSPRDEFGEPLSWLNVGSGEEIKIRDLAKLIAEITNFKGLINWDISKPDGVFRKLIDSKKFHKLGWKSKINIKKGLEITYKDFQESIESNNLRNK